MAGLGDKCLAEARGKAAPVIVLRSLLERVLKPSSSVRLPMRWPRSASRRTCSSPASIPGLELGDHGLEGFAATPLNCPGQPDPMLHADLVRAALKRLLPLDPPDLLIVQGDTSSALGGALAARELGIPLAHVEAGLRTYDPNLPWPEEENRVTIDRLSDLLFAPTSGQRRQPPPRPVFAARSMSPATAASTRWPSWSARCRSSRAGRWWPRRPFTLLVTCHRRENWGAGLDRRGRGARSRLATSGSQANVLLPPNPKVTERMTGLLGGKPGVRLIPPLSHAATIEAMRDADLVLSDSRRDAGGSAGAGRAAARPARQDRAAGRAGQRDRWSWSAPIPTGSSRRSTGCAATGRRCRR